MSTIDLILLVLWMIGIPIIGCYVGRDVYRSPMHPPRFSGQFRGGNKRSATLVGILYGVAWPILAFIVIPVIAIVAWVEAGGRDA